NDRIQGRNMDKRVARAVTHHLTRDDQWIPFQHQLAFDWLRKNRSLRRNIASVSLVPKVASCGPGRLDSFHNLRESHISRLRKFLLQLRNTKEVVGVSMRRVNRR